MAIDIQHEDVITLSKAAKAIPGRPHLSTLWRWHRRGLAGIRLETTVVGGRRFTSSEAVQRFIDRTTEARDGIRPERAVSRRRQAAIEQAERELAEAGI
jgi:hypothetical protein